MKYKNIKEKIYPSKRDKTKNIVDVLKKDVPSIFEQMPRSTMNDRKVDELAKKLNAL